MKAKKFKEILDKIFVPDQKHPSRSQARESAEIEYKLSFTKADFRDYARTMAAMANASGGVIVFGIENTHREFKGLQGNALERFETLDAKDLTVILNNHFEPEILWDVQPHDYNGNRYGVIVVHESTEKPIICKLSEGKNELTEGAIYYRYRGRTETIRFAEMRRMIDFIRKREQHVWMRHLAAIAAAGVQNAAVIDIATGKISSEQGRFLIDKDVASKLKFIKEGSFSEKEGAPTLKVLGPAQIVDTVVNAPERISRKGTLDGDAIIKDFLHRRRVTNPLLYIEQIARENTAYYPVYYYIKMTGMTIQDVLKDLANIKSTYQAYGDFVERLKGRRIKRNSFDRNVKTQAAKERDIYYQAIDKGRAGKIGFATAQEISRCSDVILSLDDKIIREQCADLLRCALKMQAYSKQDMTNTIYGKFRKVVCLIDEVMYLS